jgi:hypothetical protein
MIWEFLENGKVLNVLLICQLSEKAEIRWLGCAVDTLAKEFSIREARFQTARKALIHETQKWGAKVYAVRLKKIYAK